MIRTTAVTVAVAIALLVSTGGAQPTGGDDRLRLADLAWERGDYITALTGYQQLLSSSDAESVLEPIALQTGELYRTIELTTDGTAPQFSPDSRFISYETGTGLSRIIRVLPADGTTKPVAELTGFGAAFSPDGSKLAYLKLAASPELQAAYAGLDQIPAAERLTRLMALAARTAAEIRIVIRDLASGGESPVDTGNMRKSNLAFGAGGVLLFTGGPEGTPLQIYAAAEGRPAAPLTSGDGDKVVATLNRPGTSAIVMTRTGGGGRGGPSPTPGGGGGGGGGGRGGNASFSVMGIPDGKLTPLNATERPSFSADGRSIAFVGRDRDEYRLLVGPVTDPASASVVRHGPERIEAPALSADGSRIAYELMPSDDWEIYLSNRDGSADTRVTREIQHDLQPQFLTSDRLLGVIGEARHRRSYLYDLTSGTRTRLFHNNTVRTIAPEYTWIPNTEGNKILISAERDGDTVSPERGVYLVDLTRKVTRDELKLRVASNLASERALRAKGTRMFGAIANDIKAVVAETSVGRIYGYEKTLFDFDSKHISRPGNKLASAYLLDTYKSFGYDAQFQWFEPRNALGGRTANVVATLAGTVDPELVYVVSSHYDSVAVGPGADDDSSGTAALLETARILSGHRQAAAIIFASFTGEEAGLLGSREFVRRAVAEKRRIVGALNNDMVGWANDSRLDNTIRYSNPGIRDVQHNAALLFSNLITYDALYYKSTDAAAYYEAYGDIVGGIGSYPVLGNPHYHQSHDMLETINHQLVAEVAKTTAATLMLLANSPSRLTEFKVESFRNGTATISWKPAVESGITGYVVAYGPADKPEAQQVRVTKPSATLNGVTAGTVASVKAVNARGLEGWDWARTVVR